MRARDAIIGLLVLGAIAPPAAAAGTVSGTVRYEDRTYDSTGFTGTVLRPVRQAEVELVRDSDKTVIASTTTDDSGAYTLSTSGGPTAVFLRVYARRSTGIYNVSVRNNPASNALYTGTSSVVTLDLDAANSLSVDFTLAASEQVATAFNIFDSAVWTFQYIAFLNTLTGLSSPSPLPGITLYWEPGSTGTFYEPAQQRIRLLGKTNDNDGYDDDVILHELGHFVMHRWSRDDSAGGFHTITSLVDVRLAWSEGVATWWSSAVRAYANSITPGLYFDPWWHVDTFGTSVSAYEIETPSFASQTVTAENEVACAAVLWDVLDAPNEAHDVLPTGANPETRDDVWWVLRHYLPNLASVPVTLEDFMRGWEERVGAGDPQVVALTGDLATTRIMNHRGIRYHPDANEPNDSSAAAAALPGDGLYLNRTFFRTASPHTGDEDWFSVPLPAGTVRVETENLRDGADTVLELYNSSLTLLGSNDNRTPADKSSLVQASIVAGTYRIRVRPFTGAGQVTEFGQYDLRITMLANEPPAVTLSASATSGVAPVAITLTADASDPDGYVALWEWDLDGDGVWDETLLNGRTLTHVFATPGTFLVAVRVTDNGGFSDTDVLTIAIGAPASPTIDVAVSLSSSTAPSNVTLSASVAGITPTLYEWDFDGNGRIDRVTTIPTATDTLRIGGSYAARVYVTDASGVRYPALSDPFTISANPSAPSVSLSATPASGSVPLSGTLNATATAALGSTIVEYQWDLDGDGAFDRFTTGASVSVTWTRVGTWIPRVRAVDDLGRAADATTTVTIDAPAGNGGWLVDPPALTVDGDAVAVVVEMRPNENAKTVEFQVASAAAGPYSTFATKTTTLARAEAPWDATLVPNLAVRYLRAVVNGTPTASVSVARSTTSPDVQEFLTAAGVDKEEDVAVADTVTVWHHDGASVTFPARSSVSATDIRVAFRNLGDAGLPVTRARASSVYEVAVVLGASGFQNHYVLTLPIAPSVSDPLADMEILLWNGSSWERAGVSTVLHDEGRVRVKTYRTGTFAVFSSRPAAGIRREGSDSAKAKECFYFAAGAGPATPWAPALALAAAIAASTRKRRWRSI